MQLIIEDDETDQKPDFDKVEDKPIDSSRKFIQKESTDKAAEVSVEIEE